MGVQGLKSYIESKKDILKDCRFRSSKLIIDGSNLYFHLYFNYDLDQVHGGDYELFEKLVSRFFRNLNLCDIQPYVVLDGGTDTTGKKSDTLLKRAEDRIKRANALSKGFSGQALPMLTKNVFKQVLSKLEIPFIQCLAEADWEVAALANEWKCPVLSNDSDFYIFNISAGLLPISGFQWTDVNKCGKNWIPVKMFNVKNLCAGFNLNKNLLPLFSTILGNDYTKLNKDLLPDWASFSICAKCSVTKPSFARIDGLLTWLSSFPSPEAAIQTLCTMVNKEYSATVCMALAQGMKEYRLTASSIARFFTNGDLETSIQDPLQHVPGWMLKPLAEGKLNSIIIDVLRLQKLTLNFSVEDSRLPSSNQTSRCIRQVIYGLLLSTKQRGTGGPGEYVVEESDRQDLKLIVYRVTAILPRCTTTNLHLDTLWETPQQLRLQVLLDTLHVSQYPDCLSTVPVNLHLAVYVTCYWLKHAQPKPKAELYWALLLGLVYGELSRVPRTAEEVGPVMTKLKTLQTCKDQSALILEAAHAYSQWQCCLRDSVCLNQLLSHPIPEPECTWLYNGPLVHQAARRLKSSNSPESLLSDAPYPLKLFRRLRRVVEQELDNDLATKMSIETCARPKTEKQRMNTQRVGNESEEDLLQMFEHLTYKEEDDCDGDYLSEGGRKGKAKYDDESYNYTLSIRTRHKTKSRTRDRDTKCKKPDRVCFN